MGRTKRKDDKGGEKGHKRKRRKKARTDVSSDSDSSSEDEVQVPKKGDVLMEDALELSTTHAVVEDDVGGDSDHEVADGSITGGFTEKGGRIPSPLRDLHDPQADAKFEEYYMRLITEEFGDNLNSVREAKDFGDRSLPMLVRALKQGINIFDASEKRAVLREAT